MSVKKCLGIALGVLFLSFVFFFISQNYTHAEMRGMQSDQNHAVHMQKQAVSGPDVVVELKTTPIHLQTGSLAAILFSFKDHAGKPIKNLYVHHDRIMHVVIASQDFSVFAHIHPEEFSPVTPQMKKTAQLPVQYIFPRAGRYIIGVDFAVGEQLFSRHFLVEVSGEPHLANLKKEFSREKRFRGYDVTLTHMPKTIRAGKEVVLSYTFKKQNRPVTDLEPYLSAPMHIAIVSADLKYFKHEHGEVDGMPAGHHKNSMHMAAPARFGPRIEVHTVFPGKGPYQIFSQVQHHGKVILTSFMVEVE